MSRSRVISTACIGGTNLPVVRDLRELTAALDRRVRQVQRAGEVSIPRDADALKARAWKRINELAREQRRAEEA